MKRHAPPYIGPLPLSVPLVHRETGFSFMARLAARNGVSTRLLGLDYDIPFESVLDGEHAAISDLSVLGGVKQQELSKWTARRIDGSYHNLRHDTFHTKSIRSPIIRGCPTCLRDDVSDQNAPPEQAMAFRSHWMVKHVFICLKHGQPLINLWREASPHSRYDTAQHFADCAKGIQQGNFDHQVRECTDYDEWIDSRLENGPGSGWLDQHPLHAAATFCFLLGNALLRLELNAPSSVPIEDRWAIYQTGYAVASQGEAAIFQALKTLQQQTAFPNQGPKATFPLLYDRLAHDYATDVNFNPFKEILRRHILETWPLGTGDDLMGEPVEKRLFHSVITAAKETGVDQRRLRKMLEAQNLISPDLPDAWALFDAEAASSLLAELITFLPAKTFAETLCMTRSQFDILVEDGILKPSLSDVDTKHVWNPQEGQAFLANLFSGSEQLVQAQHGWEHISKSAARLKIRPGEIIRAIQDQRLMSIGKHADFDGYAALYVYHDQVAALLGGEVQDAISIEIFAKSVGARQQTEFRRLITRGHTPSSKIRNPRTNTEQLYISLSDAEAFHAQYYTLRTMSSKFGRSWQRLSAELAAASVKPFSPDGTNFGNIYLKSEVDHCLEQSHLGPSDTE